MKALVLASFDEAPAVMEVPDPSPGAGEVLVRVAAASVNAYDVAVAAGAMRQYMTYEFPAVIGGDLAGTIEALGDGVEGFAVGDRVFGMMGMKPAIHDGSFGELATPQAAAIAGAPSGLADVDGGSLAVAGTTAKSAVDELQLGEGSVVLVLGATGGVGAFAVQLARLQGAHVIASVRPGDEDFVIDLGAAETIDYTGGVVAEARERYPDGLDAVIDAVSPEPGTFATIAGLVRHGGWAISTRGGAGEHTRIGAVQVFNANGNPAHLAPLADLVVRGEIKVPVRKTYPLADAAQALEEFRTQHTVGKLVITM
jgi:NADPH:quinone reductase-like Zn-dependent oxidoreductase